MYYSCDFFFISVYFLFGHLWVNSGLRKLYLVFFLSHSQKLLISVWFFWSKQPGGRINHPTANIKWQTSNTKHQTSNINTKHQVPNSKHQTNIKHPSYIKQQMAIATTISFLLLFWYNQSRSQDFQLKQVIWQTNWKVFF